MFVRGLAQCSELSWQLRGLAGPRQVPNAKLALQHNLGLGGAVVVSLYQLGFPSTETIAQNSSINMTIGGEGFQCAPIFKLLAATLETDGANLVKKINGVYGFKVSGGPGGQEATWIVDVKNDKGKVEFEGKTAPDVVLSLSDVDLLDLMTGKLNAQKAFFQGKLKIKGNMGLAMKLKEFQSEIQKATTSKL